MVPIVLNFPFTVVEQVTIGFGIAVVCECKIKPPAIHASGATFDLNQSLSSLPLYRLVTQRLTRGNGDLFRVASHRPSIADATAVL